MPLRYPPGTHLVPRGRRDAALVAEVLRGAVALVVLHHVGGDLELQSGSQLRIVARDELRQVRRAELPHAQVEEEAVSGTPPRRMTLVHCVCVCVCV